MLTAMSTTNAYCTLLLNRTWSMCFFLFFSSFLYFVRNQQIEFSFMEMHMIMRIYAYEKRNYIVNVNWSSINSWQLSFWQHKYCIYCIHLPFLCDWLFVVKINLFHFHSFLSLSTSLTDLSYFFFLIHMMNGCDHAEYNRTKIKRNREEKHIMSEFAMYIIHMHVQTQWIAITK